MMKALMYVTVTGFIIGSIVFPSNAYTIVPVRPRKSPPTPAINRHAFLEGMRTFLVGSVILPLSANASVISSPSALRNLKSSLRSLSKLQDIVTLQDYEQLKQAFRLAPFSDLRKSCTALIRGGEDGPYSTQLADSYKSLIASLEKFDSTASLGMRGKTLAPDELQGQYDVLVTAFSDFVLIAEKATEMPERAAV